MSPRIAERLIARIGFIGRRAGATALFDSAERPGTGAIGTAGGLRSLDVSVAITPFPFLPLKLLNVQAGTCP